MVDKGLGRGRDIDRKLMVNYTKDTPSVSREVMSSRKEAAGRSSNCCCTNTQRAAHREAVFAYESGGRRMGCKNAIPS